MERQHEMVAESPQTRGAVQKEERKTLLRDALNPELDVARCNLDFWFREAGRRFGNLCKGRAADAVPPAWMLADGPLRRSIFEEFGFRARTEEAATRFISHIVRCSPDLETMDFYATQLIDEARHSYVFRHHLVDLGLDATRMESELDRLSGDKLDTILKPLEEFIQPSIESDDFVAMVIFLAIIAEGALAPAAEISSLRWADVDPPAAQVGYGANLDEIRHLGVGTSLVRDYLAEKEGERERLRSFIRSGLELFERLPISEMIVQREVLFQEGIEQLRDELRDAELVPGRRLLETTVEERLELQRRWSEEMRHTRLAQMGLALD